MEISWEYRSVTVYLLALVVGLASGVPPWLLVALLVGHASVMLLLCTVWVSSLQSRLILPLHDSFLFVRKTNFSLWVLFLCLTLCKQNLMSR